MVAPSSLSSGFIIHSHNHTKTRLWGLSLTCPPQGHSVGVFPFSWSLVILTLTPASSCLPWVSLSIVSLLCQITSDRHTCSYVFPKYYWQSSMKILGHTARILLWHSKANSTNQFVQSSLNCVSSLVLAPTSSFSFLTSSEGKHFPCLLTGRA